MPRELSCPVTTVPAAGCHGASLTYGVIKKSRRAISLNESTCQQNEITFHGNHSEESRTRRYRLADINAWKLYAEEFGLDSDFERNIARKVVAFLDNLNPFNMLWIATVNNEPVGSIAVSMRPDQAAFINFLLLKPEYRACGVAQTLMDTVLSHCRDHSVDLLHLETYSCSLPFSPAQEVEPKLTIRP